MKSKSILVLLSLLALPTLSFGADNKALAMRVASLLLDPACAGAVAFLNGVENQVTDIVVKTPNSETTSYMIQMKTPNSGYNTESLLMISVGMPQPNSNGELIPNIKCEGLRTQ